MAHRRQFFVSALWLLASCLATRPVRAQIVNGSFENNYTGWTLFEDASFQCAGTWGIASTGTTINFTGSTFDFFDGVLCSQSSAGLPITFTATDGNFLAYHLQNFNVRNRMHQDVTITVPSTLHWDMQYRNHAFGGLFSSNSQNLAIVVKDLANNVLQTLFTTTQGVDPPSIPMTAFSADLAAYTGSRVRISVEMLVFQRYFDAAFDNFRLAPNCTTPTIATVAASPGLLWPPNHKMVPVTVSASASASCGPPTCRITSVTSSAPVDGPGDGSTTPDWEITGDLTVNLRAERSGTWGGRLYTIAVECEDTAGNTASKTTTVFVPHDKR